MPGAPWYKMLFLASAPAQPWPCEFCTEPVWFSVDEVRITGKRALFVHHLDGDHSNDVLANLAPAHSGCHARHHHTGRRKGIPISAAQRAKISATMKGRPGPPKSATHRERIAASVKASHKRTSRPHKESTKAKISATMIGKKRGPMSAETKAKIAAKQTERWARERSVVPPS